MRCHDHAREKGSSDAARARGRLGKSQLHEEARNKYIVSA